MALIHPSIPTLLPVNAGLQRELDMLTILEKGLPPGYDVFHNVNWSLVQSGHQGFGELDLVVVGPTGHIALLEVKAGDVEETSTSLQKTYGHGSNAQTKDIGAQARRQLSAILSRLQDERTQDVQVAHLLVLPDYKIQHGSVSYPRERIVDATQIHELCTHVRNVLPNGELAKGVRERIVGFLSNQFAVYPDASVLRGQVRRASKSLAEGLATWIPRIEHTDGLFVVEATAGSGKTQLALTLLSNYAMQGKRCAYVCYNRPLSDHIAKVAPATVEVDTFHGYAVEYQRSKGLDVDFKDAQAFDKVAQYLIDHAQEQVARLDLLVVDEAQDMQPQWVEAIFQRLKPDGRLYVLGDPDQNLYARETFDLPKAVRIHCMENFRSPGNVVHTLNAFRLSSEPVQARLPWKGSEPCFHVYHGDNCTKALERTVQTLVNDGFSADQIAVVTFSGREKSKVLGKGKITDIAIRQFTGGHDKAGNELWSDGEILIETLYRFKGQSAPAVVLCEVDFEQLTEREIRKLFVGFTRAQIRLEVVLSERAEQLLAARLA
jgi:hypothetical protein